MIVDEYSHSGSQFVSEQRDLIISLKGKLSTGKLNERILQHLGYANESTGGIGVIQGMMYKKRCFHSKKAKLKVKQGK